MPRWFRKKHIGYGWTPNSWQGWAITGLFAAACVIVSLPRFHLDQMTRRAAIFSLFAALIVAIVFTSGRDSDP